MLSNYATTIATLNGITRVTYHNTVIVAFTANVLELNTGGFWSVTTKKKMNQASEQFDLGFKVYQKEGTWFVTHKEHTQPYSNVLENENKCELNRA